MLAGFFLLPFLGKSFLPKLSVISSVWSSLSVGAAVTQGAVLWTENTVVLLSCLSHMGHMSLLYPSLASCPIPAFLESFLHRGSDASQREEKGKTAILLSQTLLRVLVVSTGQRTS